MRLMMYNFVLSGRISILTYWYGVWGMGCEEREKRNDKQLIKFLLHGFCDLYSGANSV
jgi:hypothetical protein